MTKEAALQSFFEEFGIDVYAATAVQEDVTFPWLTYEQITGSWGEGKIAITVNLWYYTTSESVINAKAREIYTAIGQGGVQRACDGGTIWINRGNWQPLEDETDKNVKRRYTNMSVEYFTLN